MKYHINPTTGRANICRAEKRPCPVGGDHFGTKAEAEAAHSAALAKTTPTFSPFQRTAVAEKDRLLGLLTEGDRETARKYGLRYEGEGDLAVSMVSRGVRGNIAALRSLSEKLGGPVTVLNGGAYQRFQASGSQWTIELQVDGKGMTYARVFNAGVPVYGDHSRDRAWTFPARSNIISHAETVAKLYEDFINDPENQKSEPMWG